MTAMIPRESVSGSACSQLTQRYIGLAMLFHTWQSPSSSLFRILRPCIISCCSVAYGPEVPEWKMEKHRFYCELPGDMWEDGYFMNLVHSQFPPTPAIELSTVQTAGCRCPSPEFDCCRCPPGMRMHISREPAISCRTASGSQTEAEVPLSHQKQAHAVRR